MKVEVHGTPVEEKEKKGEYGEFDKWDIEQAARTLREAEEIKADKKKMKYVSKCLKKDLKAAEKAVSGIQGMRDKYAKMKDEEE